MKKLKNVCKKTNCTASGKGKMHNAFHQVKHYQTCKEEEPCHTLEKEKSQSIRTDSNLTQMCDLAERNIEMVVINVLLVFKC